jgi:hypothetical protein
MQRLLGEVRPGRLGDAEVDHLGHRPAIVLGDQHVGGLNVAVDDALVVRVLDRLADRHKQLQPLPRRQLVRVAVARDRHALDQLHDEEGPAVGRRPGVEDPGDVRVVHQGQGLPLRLEARQHLLAVHPRLDQLDSDEALDRLGLLGHPDRAHAAFAHRLQQLEPAGEHDPGLLHAARFGPRSVLRAGFRRFLHRPDERARGLFEEAGVAGVGPQQGFHAGPQFGVAGAGRVEVGGPLSRAGEPHGVGEDLALVHGMVPPRLQCAVGRQNPRRILQDFSIARLSQALA